MRTLSHYPTFSEAWLHLKQLSVPSRVASIALACIPFSMFLGPFFTDLCIALVGIGFIYHSYCRQSWDWLSSSWVKAFLAFWLFMMARALGADDMVEAFTHSFLLFRYGLLTTAMAYWLLATQEARSLLIYGTLAAVSFAVIDGLVQFLIGFDLFGKPPFHNGRLAGPLNRPRLGLTMAWLGVPLLALALAKLSEAVKEPLVKAKWLLLSFGIVLIGVISGDRGGLLEMLLGITLLALFIPQYRLPLIKVSCLLPLLLALVFSYSPQTFERQVVSTIDKIKHFSSSDYGVVYQGGLYTFFDYPLLGVGARQYRDICPQNHGDLRMASTSGGDEVRVLNEEYLCGHHPHNLYLELLSEGGLIGASLFFYLFFIVLRRAWQLRSQLRLDAFVLGCVAVLLSRLFPAFPAGSLYVVWASVPLWLMLGIIWAVCLPRFEEEV